MDQVRVTVPLTGIGSVTSNPAGINCPPTCAASFAQNMQVTLTAVPSANYFFGGWSGVCSGTSSCTLNATTPLTATAIFAPARSAIGSGPGTKVIAYVFTPDSLAGHSSEFALLADGELKAGKHVAEPLLMTGTAHGLVTDLSTATAAIGPMLQSYSVQPDGSLLPEGHPVTVAMDRSITLASDSTYVYAATDEGVFGFADTGAGLSSLPAVQLTVAPPASCSPAQENANECFATGELMLTDAGAFFLQAWAGNSGPSLYELNSFDRSLGQLTGEQFFAGNVVSSGIFAPTPDGNFVFALDLASNRVLRYAKGENGSYQANVLSNGQQLSDGFAQLIISADGSLLFAPVSEAAESPRIRVFQIDHLSGDLTEVIGSPFLTGEYYLVSAALDPTGHFLLALHADCNSSPPCTPGKLVAMRVNMSTGALSISSDVEDGQNPFSITAVSISH